jgi:hypothetical protein
MYTEIKRAIADLLNCPSTNKHEEALINWVDLLTGPERFEEKVKRVISGRPPYPNCDEPIWSRFEKEEDIVACSRLVAAMILADTAHAGEFLDCIIKDAIGSREGMGVMVLRHGTILGIMKAVSILDRLTKKRKFDYGFSFEHPIMYLPRLVVNFLSHELRGTQANEQSTLLAEFVSIYTERGLLAQFGSALRDAQEQTPRIDCPGQDQFVNVYSHHYLNTRDSEGKLRLLHPVKRPGVGLEVTHA